MKITKISVWIVLGILLALPTLAAVFDSPNLITKDQIINDDVYIASNNVDVEGLINGDLTVAAGTVTLNGKVNGDVVVTGGKLIINGEVTDDVRAAGGEIDINGKINDDLIAAGGEVTIGKDAIILGSASIFSGSVDAHGKVGEDLDIVSYSRGDVNIGGETDGNMNVKASNIHLLNSAKINGQFNYTSNNEAMIDQGAEIKGGSHYTIIGNTSFGRETISFIIYWFLASLITGIILILIFPEWLDAVGVSIKKNPLKSMGIGAISFVIVSLLVIFFFVTIIGIPIALLFLLFFVIALYLTKIFTSIWIGSLAFYRRRKKLGRGELILRFTGGLIILTILFALPYLGYLARFLSLILGFGGIITYYYFTKDLLKRRKEV